MKKQTFRPLLALPLVFGFFIAAPPELTRAATLLVTNVNDSGAGSLRQAILTANGTLNIPDIINFNISGAGPHTITLLTPLPAITDPVVIDGYTQSGAST